MNSIIVCEEKHGTYYWDASTEKVLHASALAILKHRFLDGMYYAPECPDPAPGQITYDLELELAVVEELPACQCKTEALARIEKQTKEDYRNYLWLMDCESEWRAINRALETNDGELALKILKLRAEHEYEGFDIVELTEPNDFD